MPLLHVYVFKIAVDFALSSFVATVYGKTEAHACARGRIGFESAFTVTDNEKTDARARAEYDIHICLSYMPVLYAYRISQSYVILSYVTYRNWHRWSLDYMITIYGSIKDTLCSHV